MPVPVIQKAVRSIKWSAFIEIVSRIAPSMLMLILAHLLTPTDFGVVATAMIAINFSQTLWDAGLGTALVQTQESLEHAANVVFWTNIVLGIVVYGALFVAAPGVAAFFNSPASTAVLRVLGLQVVIASFASVQQMLFVRDLAFQQLFWVKLVAAFVPGLVSVPLALLGFGVWALVAGALVGSLLNLVMMWHKSPWRPRMNYDWRLAQRLFGFGAWVVGEGLTAWFFGWGDNLLVGKFLGVNTLGTYQLGWSILTLVFGLLLAPFAPVLYSTLSQLQGDPTAVKSTFHKAIRTMSALSLPAGTGFLISGTLIASVFFGDKWHGLGLILSLIGFMHGFMGLLGVNPETYRAMGRPDINAKLQFGFVLIYLPVYLLLGPLGLEVFTFARMGLGLVTILVHVALSVRLLGVSPLYLWHDSKSSILATALMGIVLIGVKGALVRSAGQLPGVVMLAILVMTGGIIYLTTLWLLDRSFVLQTKNSVLKAVFNR